MTGIGWIVYFSGRIYCRCGIREWFEGVHQAAAKDLQVYQLGTASFPMTCDLDGSAERSLISSVTFGLILVARAEPV